MPKKVKEVSQSPEAAVNKSKEALKQHRKALKELHACTGRFTRALAAVAASFQRLASNTHTPVIIQSSGALVCGIDEVRDGVALQDLMEELNHLLSVRFEMMVESEYQLKESWKRKCKAEKTLALLRMQCDKLEPKKNADARAQELFMAENQKRRKHEVECLRLRAEFEDTWEEFVSRLGTLIYEDMRALSEQLHRLFSALSYQFRECKGSLLANAAAPLPLTVSP
ncbi:hypothetical protein LSCM1_04773 [Leishmania martiniquensis]|uniref:BAR domain-containing protein n=1 Tax=Leishmania martiniquensis TaxID=1580590 RepID=A0A836H4T3_9TRYP|nr:hypothetical protein LSCM1_04773 [Leishmania martiniquensis]